jgi:two-component system CheB/CheR fusion protein
METGLLMSDEGRLTKTPRKHGEKDVSAPDQINELRADLERHSSLLDQVYDPIIEWDLDGSIVYWSRSAQNLYGHAANQAIGKDVHKLLATSTEGGMDAVILSLKRDGQWEGRLVHTTCDGRQVIVESRMRALGGDARKTILEINRDVTQSSLAEEALRNSEEQYRASFELAAVGKAQVDPDSGRFLRVNRKLADITGYSPRELLEMNFSQLMPAEGIEAARADWRRVLDGHVADFHLETRCIRKNGEPAWVSVTGAVARDAQGKPLRGIVVVQDITDRMRTQEELTMHRERLEELVAKRTRELEHTHQRLRLSERMAALGTLSAGLGHDMGNLLLPLRLRLDSIEAKGVAPGLREDLDAIRKCAEYLQRLANGLRLFALDPDAREAASESTDLNEWWPDVYSFYKNSLPRPITLETRFAPETPCVRLGRPNLTQAIFNLVQNAGDALRGKEDGSVVVWAESGSDNTVRLGVTDTGIGMASEIRQRCLEPFFTTKTRGISTGLGLALVHGIVQKAGGTIQIESTPGQGTTFVLTLRAAGAPRLSTTPSNGARSGPYQPRAVVSVKDPRLRAYVGSVLHSLAFEVDHSDVPHDSDAILWLTDPDARLTTDAQRFLADGRCRRVIVLGPALDGLDKLNGVVQFRQQPKPAEIRQALRDTVDEFAALGLMASPFTARDMGG